MDSQRETAIEVAISPPGSLQESAGEQLGFGYLELFLDDQSIDSDTFPGQNLVNDTFQLITVGASRNSGGVVSFPFFGLIDDVRIYNRALTRSEITELATTDP